MAFYKKANSKIMNLIFFFIGFWFYRMGVREEIMFGEKSVKWSILSQSPFGDFCIFGEGVGG